MQLPTAVYSFLVTTFLMRICVVRPLKLVVPRGSLIISNHQSWSDPFLITYHLGWRNVFRNLPVHFPVTSHFMTMPLIRWYLWSLQCFNVGDTNLDRARALIRMRDLLQSKQTVMLFPEGRCIRDSNNVEEFHRGIDMLLMEDIPLVLVRVENFNNWSILPGYPKPTMTLTRLPDQQNLEEKREVIRSFYKDTQSKR